MKQEWLIEQRLRNVLHSAMIVAGMLALLGALGWFLGGWGGVFLLAVLGTMILAAGLRATPAMVLRLYGAQPLRPADAPILFRLAAELALRAQLPGTPRLYHVPSAMVNAFSVGSPEDAAITVTDGLLHKLNQREMLNVLAHEVAHIRHNDLRVMSLADFVSRMTFSLSWFGQLLLLINLPLIATSAYSIPWLLIWLLILAPALASLMQLALSRSREFDADLGAVSLTGDPRGLASALRKIEAIQAGLVERILLPGRRIPEPSLLRTHPNLEERLRRLAAMEEEATDRHPPHPEHPLDLHHASHKTDHPLPRWRATGLWH